MKRTREVSNRHQEAAVRVRCYRCDESEPCGCAVAGLWLGVPVDVWQRILELASERRSVAESLKLSCRALYAMCWSCKSSIAIFRDFTLEMWDVATRRGLNVSGLFRALTLATIQLCTTATQKNTTKSYCASSTDQEHLFLLHEPQRDEDGERSL
jgi:hypothetical protein